MDSNLQIYKEVRTATLSPSSPSNRKQRQTAKLWPLPLFPVLPRGMVEDPGLEAMSTIPMWLGRGQWVSQEGAKQ